MWREADAGVGDAAATTVENSCEASREHAKHWLAGVFFCAEREMLRDARPTPTPRRREMVEKRSARGIMVCAHRRD